MYEYYAQVLDVVDGDTVHVVVQLGMDAELKTTLRFARINTPEIHGVPKDSQEYQKGIAAQKFVMDYVKGTNNNIRIVTVKDKREKYGRYLAEIYALEGPFAGTNLNDELVKDGFAVLYDGK